MRHDTEKLVDPVEKFCGSQETLFKGLKRRSNTRTALDGSSFLKCARAQNSNANPAVGVTGSA
jgi:hypothetical protein